MKRTLQAAARVFGGQLIGLPDGADRPYSVVSSDSRTLGPGALFVALRGPKFDGALFVAAAAARGAVGAIVDRASVDRAVPCALPLILVEDALRALQHLARAWRADH
jgi:UDP-N-acetylmuramoyl-tripeptide--D-alanyl-D-alanine ligase